MLEEEPGQPESVNNSSEDESSSTESESTADNSIDDNPKADEGNGACPLPNWKADGFCDDDNNVEACDFDGGDCCDSPKANWNFFCKVNL